MSQYTGVHVYQHQTGDIHAVITILLQRGLYYVGDVDKERISVAFIPLKYPSTACFHSHVGLFLFKPRGNKKL